MQSVLLVFFSDWNAMATRENGGTNVPSPRFCFEKNEMLKWASPSSLEKKCLESTQLSSPQMPHFPQEIAGLMKEIAGGLWSLIIRPTIFPDKNRACGNDPKAP